MLNINCLLNNTSLKEDLENMIEYMGYDRISNKKDPSVGAIFEDLQKAGVEVDLRTVGELYKVKLSHQSEIFTQPAAIDNLTGRDTEITLRNLMLRKPLEGVKKIGKMSPEEFIANGLMRTFRSNIVEDTRTKSIMRTLQDAAHAQARRMVGELPVAKGDVPAEHWEETVKNALQLDKIGYNNLEGTINNARTLFEGMKAEIVKNTAEINGKTNTTLDRKLAELKETYERDRKAIEKSSDLFKKDKIRQLDDTYAKDQASINQRYSYAHDGVVAQQWNDYVNSLETATYSLLLSGEQGKNILHGALMDAGYKKEMKGGKSMLDYNALAGNINDVSTLRRTVRSVLEEKGYSPETSARITDALQKEFHEMRGTMIERAQRESKALQESWDNMTPAQQKSVDLNDMVNKRLISWDNYKQLSGDTNKKIEFSKGEGLKIITDALKSEGLGKEIKGGKSVLDWTKSAGEIKDPADIQAKVEAFLQKKGYPADIAAQISEAIQKKYVEVRQDILDHAKQRLDSMQDRALSPISPIKKTDLQRLGEYHDMGIFEGQHDDLLNHVLGVDKPTRDDMRQLNEIGRMSAELSRDVAGDDYLASPLFQQFQREVNDIIGRNIDNKTKFLKVTAALSHYFQLQNMGMIGNAFNIMENNLSGAKEMMSANLNLLNKAGLESAFKDGKLLKETWKNISAGGAEYGDSTGKFGAHSFIADRFNLKDLNGEMLKNPKKYGKVLATVAMAPAKAWLNGSDGAYKAAIHKKLMVSALHKALTEKGVSKGEAAQRLNEALYGQSMEDARKQANDMLVKYGQDNSKSAIERLANNLVIQNLNADALITKDMIEAAYKSSYNVASLGMGHEANNWFSKKLLAGKAKAASREKELIRNEQWGDLAWHRVNTSVVYNGLLRFAGGAANWIKLRLQSGLGLGIATGYLGKYRKGDELDFDSPEKLQATMKDYLQARQEIARGTVGLGFMALNAAMIAAYGATRKKDDEEDANEGALVSGYKGMAKNYAAKKLFNKTGSDLLVLQYLAETSKAKHNQLDAGLSYAQNLFNGLNPNSPSATAIEAIKDARRGDKGAASAVASMFKIAGNMTETPFYKTYKQAGQLINYGITGADPTPKYVKPYNVLAGYIGGGMFEDMGLYDRTKAPLYAIPGVGDKLAAEAAEMGINTVKDLKNNPGWLESNLSGKKLESALKVYNDVYGGDNPAAVRKPSANNSDVLTE